MNKFKFTFFAAYIVAFVMLFTNVGIAQTTIVLPQACNCPSGPDASTNGSAVVSNYGNSTCANPSQGTINGTMTAGTPVSGVTMSLYANVTTLGTYNLSATQNGVTFTGSGTFTTLGCQLITLTATGTPTAAGPFTWCTNTTPQGCSPGTVQSAAPSGTVTAFNCAAAVPSPATYNINGSSYSGTVSLAYTGGNGGTYAAGSVASTGVTGFTATWAAGTLASGAGSISITITGSSTTPGIASFPVTIAGQSCTITLSSCGAFVSPGVFKAFLCHNLGANTSLDPHDMTQTNAWGLNGAYVAWGRRGPNTTGDSRVDWVTAANNGPGGFAAAPTGPTAGQANSGTIAGWITTEAPNFSWRTAGGAKTANDPCPSGWRVPTNDEWNGVVANNTESRSGTWTDSPTNYNSAIHFGPNSSTKRLTLPAAGFRGHPDGTFLNRGSYGVYWSSTENGSFAHYYNFDGSTLNGTNNNGFRRGANTIRCIAE